MSLEAAQGWCETVSIKYYLINGMNNWVSTLFFLGLKKKTPPLSSVMTFAE